MNTDNGIQNTEYKNSGVRIKKTQHRKHKKEQKDRHQQPESEVHLSVHPKAFLLASGSCLLDSASLFYVTRWFFFEPLFALG
jgi:hypothetical protein